jgi:hypothetical protein
MAAVIVVNDSLPLRSPGADCPLADPAAIFDRRHRRVQSHGARVRHLSRKAQRLHSGLAIAHAVLSKEHWLADVGVQAW